jgi:hypothetical protein
VISSGTQFHSVISTDLFPLEDITPFGPVSNNLETNTQQPPDHLSTSPGAWEKKIKSYQDLAYFQVLIVYTSFYNFIYTEV